jgi:hypothetical protein
METLYVAAVPINGQWSFFRKKKDNGAEGMSDALISSACCFSLIDLPRPAGQVDFEFDERL